MITLKKSKRIFTALSNLSLPQWWQKNWQRVAFLFFLTIFIFLFIFRFLPIPFSAYMVQQKIGHILQGDFRYKMQYDWVNLENISPSAQLAVIASEDQRFPDHFGFDFEAIQQAIKYNEKSPKRVRGASTISQQTAKNLILWHGQNWLRNGIFGIEAASHYYFKKAAKNLTSNEAALLAAILPNPIIYNANKPSALIRKKQAWILRQMRNLGTEYLNDL